MIFRTNYFEERNYFQTMEPDTKNITNHNNFINE